MSCGHYYCYYYRKNNNIHFNYCVTDGLIMRSDCVKYLGVMLDSKLYLHCHVDFVYSQELRTLGLIHYVIYIFCSLIVLHNAVVTSKLEYASVIWNNLTSTDFNITENIQRKFANSCYYRSFVGLILCVITI
jgi:hypothetical protein